MPRKKNRYESANEEDSDSDDEIISSQSRYVLTIPSVIYNTVASENTWTIALVALFMVTAVGVLGILLDDGAELEKSNYYYESYDGSDQIIFIPKVLYPLEDISRDEIFQEEEEVEEEKEFGNDMIVEDITMAFFVDVPNSGGDTFLRYMIPCFGLIGASDITQITDQEFDTESLQVVNTKNGQYVNVNTYTTNGLLYAKQLKLMDNTDDVNIDVLSTPLFYESLNILFSSSSIPSIELEENDEQRRRIRMITFIRDPVERVLSLYNQYNKDNTSLLQYLKDNNVQDNYMTRLLVNKLSSKDKKELTKDDLIEAKQILFQKCIIGLYNEKSESVDRFKKLFHWKFVNDDSKCATDDFVKWQYDTNDNEFEMVDEDSEDYALLVSRNVYDVELYQYAKDLFIEQGSLFI